MGLFDRLKRGLEKTRQILRTDIRDLFRAGEILDDVLLSDFEARLIRTDMGFSAATRIIGRLREQHGGRTVDVEAIWKTVREELIELLRGQSDVRW
ncbi:MAG: signal recognition particle receptor subunit alpha, partial [Planctomycetaceae bacterium]